IPYDETLYEELRTMQKDAASVWNDIVREATSYYFTFKKWLSKTEIQAVRKQTYNLHSQTVQAIADKYEANRETIRRLRQTDKKGPSKTKIRAFLKQTYNLHSQTVKAIAEKYEANRKTIRRLSQTDKKAKYPWRKKHYYCIPLKKASMTIPYDKIAIKKSEYAI